MSDYRTKTMKLKKQLRANKVKLETSMLCINNITTMLDDLMSQVVPLSKLNKARMMVQEAFDKTYKGEKYEKRGV